MNRRIFTFAAILAVVFALLISFPSDAAEYTVRQGDTLTKIAEVTGHTVAQLIIMSDIKQPDILHVGQKITFVSQDDKLRAKVWAETRRSELNPVDQNHRYFGWFLEDLEQNRIRYSIERGSGTHFSTILIFAEAQGKIYRVK